MDKETASKIIRETFNDFFDKERFIKFTKELFNYYEPDTFIYRGNFIPDAFDPHIKTLERVGKYTDPDGNKIDILIVQLKRASSLERARTMQRNFIAWYLNGSRGGELKDAAIVAFIAPDHGDWRFSLVKMDYHLEEGEGGKVKTRKELTPAKRWSFLVGENENSHTAQRQLLEILQNDSDYKILQYDRPLLSDFEQAFNIEKVTREFFEKYRELFINVKEALEDIVQTNQSVKREFEAKSIDTVDFAKKLLGQIVFLYFLQKKGWFGVKRGQEWGFGSKHFLRELFNKKHGDYKNFFNNVLEPLFYEALRLERSGDYYSRFDCRIPFLNGGLFDPINDYDWWNTDICLPNEIFANKRKTKEDDVKTGILDVFDRYNFTVKEDEPLEKDVAVDPEMLGKVFENLLEVKDRKSKGTYYTPREIVHYMCQESLTNYLATELSSVIPAKAGIQLPTKEDIETLIKYGETVVEHDTTYLEKTAGNGSYKGRYDKAKLPDNIRKHAKLIDEKLASIRVCDPAVGSGAFPVGMMNEIIRTRNALTPYIGKNGERTPYHFKREAIQNCLYGVDIDPGAIEIAKLRLWLSLVVDEEERATIQPLPNLDYKIMQGNSLIEILTPQLLVGTADKKKYELIRLLKKAKDELFGISDPSSKDKKRKEVESLLNKIIEHDRKVAIQNLKSQMAGIKNQGKLFTDKKVEDAEKKEILALEQKIQEIENLKLPGPTEHFEWHLNFSEVFHEKKGFDVVIANPPYVNLEKIEAEVKLHLQKNSDVFAGKADILYFFFEKGILLLSKKGTLAFITSRYYIEATYAKKLRQFIVDHCHIDKLIDFHNHPIFESVGIHSLVTILNCGQKNQDTTVAVLKKKTENISFYEDFEVFNSNLSSSEWVLIPKKDKGLSEKIKNNNHLLGDIAVIEQGQKTGKNDAFVVSNDIANGLEKEPLKKLIKNSHINKYFVDFKNLYLIYTDDSFAIDKFPKIKKHLLKYENELRSRAEAKDGLYPWYRLQRPRSRELFEAKIKIVVPYRAEQNKFAYDDQQYFNDGGDIRIIVLKNPSEVFYKYCLALLNSAVINYYFQFIGRRKGNVYEFFRDSLAKIPIKQASHSEQIPIKNLVDKILAVTKDDNYLQNSTKQAKACLSEDARRQVREYEKQIDKLVYKLYDLTPDEIATIEGKNRQQ